MSSPDAADAATSLRRRPAISINSSPLARKIVSFNLLALAVLVLGVIYFSPSRDMLVRQLERDLVVTTELIADVFEALPDEARVPARFQGVIAGLDLPAEIEVQVFDPTGVRIATSEGLARFQPPASSFGPSPPGGTVVTDALDRMWTNLASVFAKEQVPTEPVRVTDLIDEAAQRGEAIVKSAYDDLGATRFAIATPVMSGGEVVAIIAVTSAAGEVDRLIRSEREQILQIFVIAMLVSIGLSLVLASAIATPLADLAAAAETGGSKDIRSVSPARVHIPDLSARPDEIGRLSGALRAMLGALYHRIDANEQFAADVAHEIKNPLASLRSAVGTLRSARTEAQRDRLLDVIDHDVRRLDRLVSDISNASRLDSELVTEAEVSFDLLHTLKRMCEFYTEEAAAKDVAFFTDFPDHSAHVQGLEARLAQVFVNLITNALSFCAEGDAIRVWLRRRGDRILVVVEDTGPGVPDQALERVFERFYSERPEGQFGNNSGLGLAISKQIVEAHGGVIWAENIRPTANDPMSEPLGARFVVGLPV